MAVAVVCLLPFLCLAAPPATSRLSVATDHLSHLFISDMTLAYQLPQPSVAIFTRPAESSLANVAAVTQPKVDFAVDSSGLSASQVAAYPTLILFPALCSAVVGIYRLDLLLATTTSPAVTFVLSAPLLAQVFTGNIRWWNDSRLAAVNPALQSMGLQLPNATITVVLQDLPSAATIAFTAALSHAWPAFNASIGITDNPQWPTQNYAAFRTALGVNTVPSTVLAVDGSIGYAPQSEAILAGVQVADLVNRAGNRVSPSTSSVNAAATDLGTIIPALRTTAVDLTNSAKAAAWPITAMSYIMLDLQYGPAVGGCASRYALVQFLLWYYSSSVVTALLASRQAVPVPPIVLSQMGVVSQVGTTIRCNGSVIPPATSPVVRINSHGAQAVIIGPQLTAAYAAVSNITFQAPTQTDATILAQMTASQVDLGFMAPQNINASYWASFVDSGDFFIFPLYQLAVSLIFNPQLTLNLTMPSNASLVLDMAAQIQIFYSCIDTWAHPSLLALNPWLETLLQGSMPPIQLITGCGATPNTAPLTSQLLYAFDVYLAQNPNDAITHKCVTEARPSVSVELLLCTSAFNSSINGTASNRPFRSRSEGLLPALSLAFPGAISYMQIVDNAAYGVPLIAQHGVVANSSLSGLTACVQNVFDATTLTVNRALTTDPTCWPMTQQLVTLVRRRYYSTAINASSCTRGLDALQYLHWLFTNDGITPLLEASNFLRLSSSAFPDISAAYVAALDTALCDDQTLVITLPTVWSLSAALSGVYVVLGSLGSVLSVAAIAFIVGHRHSPVMRSASPLFMVISLVGLVCLFLATVLLALSPTTVSCSAMNWMWNLGFDLTFAPLFAKTWRIWRIFGRKKLTVIKISNRKLLVLVAAQLLVDLVLLSVWQSLSPMQPISSIVYTGSNPVKATQYSQCGVDGDGTRLFALVCVIKGLLLLFGAVMGFSTRNVQSSYNESSAIALTIYNVVFSVGVVVPTALLISAVGDVLVVLQQFLLLWVGCFSLVALCGPKLLLTYSRESSARKSMSLQGSDMQAPVSFVALSGFSSLPLLQTYVSALREHLREAEAKALKMKISHAPLPGCDLHRPNNSITASDASAPITRPAAANVTDSITDSPNWGESATRQPVKVPQVEVEPSPQVRPAPSSSQLTAAVRLSSAGSRECRELKPTSIHARAT